MQVMMAKSVLSALCGVTCVYIYIISCYRHRVITIYMDYCTYVSSWMDQSVMSYDRKKICYTTRGVDGAGKADRGGGRRNKGARGAERWAVHLHHNVCASLTGVLINVRSVCARARARRLSPPCIWTSITSDLMTWTPASAALRPFYWIRK